MTPVADSRSFSFASLDAARSALFHDVPGDLAAWAFERMVPQQIAPLTTPMAA